MAASTEVLELVVWTVLGLMALSVAASTIKVPKEWERMAVLRLGKYRGMRGPGLFFRVPVIDQIAYTIDMRTIVEDIPKQKMLTRDNIPATIDAILYYKVENPEKAVLSVDKYHDAIALGAATLLRDVVGRRDLDDLLQKREEVATELKHNLDSMSEPWGVDILNVEISDISISATLEDAMTREASAVRERRARTQLALAEKEIASTLVDAAKTYEEDPVALEIRSMNMLYEMCMEGKATTIFIPTETALQMRSPIGAYGVLGDAKDAGAAPRARRTHAAGTPAKG